jgi:iron uptake system component EfeO
MTARRNARRLCALAMVPLLVTAAACGDDDGGGSGGSGGSGDGDAQSIDVTISDAGCDPDPIEATAGPVTFDVTNDGSASVTEFEVLDGDDHIVGEVENIIPGDERSFSVTLEEGEYVSYCPNGTDVERGTIRVAAASGGSEGAGAAGAAELSSDQQDAVDHYLAYVGDQTAALTSAVGPFADAVSGGNVDEAERLFAAAREPYETIEPIAESFGDLDPEIDAREGDVPDDEWGGFHRIERALWQDHDIAGMSPVAEHLVADVRDLQQRIPEVSLEPAQIANGAVELLNEVSTSKITGEEDRYSHTDLSDFAANFAGTQAAFEALRPLLGDDQADLVDEIDQRTDELEAALADYESTDPVGNGYVLYNDLSERDTRRLSAAVDALAEPMSQVAALVVS